MAQQTLNTPRDTTLQDTNVLLGQIRDAIGSPLIIGETDISSIADGTLTGAVANFASQKGAANGVASLDNGGKIPESQLPSYVDDVLEYASLSDFPAAGEKGKIYTALDTNIIYRWGGSSYIAISEPDIATTNKAGIVKPDGTSIEVAADGQINVKTTFSDATTRTNIASGDSITTIWGKIKKFFADLKTVAFSGSYDDLTDKPTIPTVNNGTLTIQKNGTDVQTFTANQSSNATANITVPTKTSELANDSGFVTSNTDTKATQTNTTTNADYRVLFSNTADDTTRTEGARKNTGLKYNPSTHIVTVGSDSTDTTSDVKTSDGISLRTMNTSKLSTTGASTNNTVAFTSNDDATVFNSGNLGGQSTYPWTGVAKLATGEKHSSIMNKVSTMFKNIRYIAKMIGTTDISAIGDGTLTGGISTLNSNLSGLNSRLLFPDGSYAAGFTQRPGRFILFDQIIIPPGDTTTYNLTMSAQQALLFSAREGVIAGMTVWSTGAYDFVSTGKISNICTITKSAGSFDFSITSKAGHTFEVQIIYFS